MQYGPDFTSARDELRVFRGRAMAFDRRSFSPEGHLHVDSSCISKSCVNPYIGREIPNNAALGLDPNRVYRLYRDPFELDKGAASFENKPLLLKHIAVSADAPATELVVGTVGSPVTFEAPYLKAPLAIWAADAIELIESGAQAELSCAYRYRADMTPGRVDGQSYDGVMRDIVGNHVALVDEGRAGGDVVVGDSASRAPAGVAALGLGRIKSGY